MRTSQLFQMSTVNTHFYSLSCSLQNNRQMIKRMYKSHSLYDQGARSTATTMVIFSNYCTVAWHSNERHLSNFVVTFVSNITKPNNRTAAIFYTNSNLCLRWGEGVGCGGPLSHTFMEIWQTTTTIIITIYLTANGLSPGGSGYNACT